MTTFGFGFEAGRNVLPIELAHLMHDRLGATRIRFMWQRPLIQKEKDGPLDLSFINPSIDNAIAAGLVPSAGLYFFNDWMTGGPWLRSYDCPCTKSARSIKANEGAPPECFQITYDSSAIFNQAAALATAIGDRVKWYDPGNEPGEDEYFHGITDETPQQRIERWFWMIALPFVRGVRSVQPAAKFRAQLDAYCDYAHLLEIEQEGGERCFDEIYVHPYADSMGQIVAKYIDEFEARMLPYLDGRPMGVGEIQHADNLRLLRMLEVDVTEHNAARYITMHQVWPGTLLPGLPGGDGKFELTDEGERFSRQMMPPRRRPSRTL